MYLLWPVRGILFFVLGRVSLRIEGVLGVRWDFPQTLGVEASEFAFAGSLTEVGETLQRA